MAKQSFVRELLDFMRRDKKWWLLPLVTGSVIVLVLLLFNRSAGNAPFLYPQF
jgi:hypothetical protein